MDYRKALFQIKVLDQCATYIYALLEFMNPTTDLLFSGHLLISENGSLLKENNRFQRENEVIYFY